MLIGKELVLLNIGVTEVFTVGVVVVFVLFPFVTVELLLITLD
jgi:hypothetical protein